MAAALASEQCTMTLATARQGISWAAPVYYVLFRSAFFFFSDPGSRHVQEAADSGQASCAVHTPAATWQEIRGLQMSGRIGQVISPLEAAAALRAYLGKFPFTKEFFRTGESPDLEAFLNRFRVRLYRFQPSLVYYLDNRVQFGFRMEVRF
jgi:uncharacterized protein YhbP (UPF0306 family)